MLKFILEYGWVLIAALLLVLVYLKEGWDGIRAEAYKAMLYMEREYPDDAGRTKFLVVLENIYPLLPKSLRYFLTEEQFAKKLQDWYDDSKDFLDDGKIDQSA